MHRQIMSVADVGESISSLADVKAHPQQLVAIPMGALFLILSANSEQAGLTHHTNHLALKAAVETAEELMPSTFKQHVPEPMPA
jgi:hypothetical protein